MAIQIGTQGTITASTRITIDSAKQSQVQSYAFSVYTNIGVCILSFEAVVYALSATIGIGTLIYDDISLTIPTSYTAISNPDDPGQNYYTLTGNTITGTSFCD
jgi:hypothetical protein